MYKGMHEGDLAQALTDYQMAHMPVAEMMGVCRVAIQNHFESLPADQLVAQYQSLVGDEDHG